MRRLLRWLLLIIPIVLLIAVGGFVVWANTVPEPMPEAVAAMQSDAEVQVTHDGWLIFQPTAAEPTTGLIFYPGGRVSGEAYAPAMHEIAAQDYLAVVVPMPLNLAILGVDRAKDVVAAYPQIEHWVIAGHSLGGSMAARFAHDNPDLIDGLVLWATYPEDSKDLSASDLVAASIYGTLDGLATTAKIDTSRPLLPANAELIAIQGGNHAQFGWYGAQAGDNTATISREDQQAQIIAATLAVLEEVQG